MHRPGSLGLLVSRLVAQSMESFKTPLGQRLKALVRPDLAEVVHVLASFAALGRAHDTSVAPPGVQLVSPRGGVHVDDVLAVANQGGSPAQHLHGTNVGNILSRLR